MERKKVKIIVLTGIVIAITAMILFVVQSDNNEKITSPESTVRNSTSVQTTENTTESTTEPTSNSTSEPSSVTTEPATESTTVTTTKPTTEQTQTTGGSTKKVDILINYENFLPDDWEVDLVELRNGEQVDRIAYDSLQKMMDDCRAEGYNPLICSSYRTYEKQTRLYNNQIQKYINMGYPEDQAKIEAGKWVAVPGTSEHQTGLALDIVSIENQNLDESQLKNPCQQWLMEHCYDYGFILRYPVDKSDITKIGFEPWHYRYVGIKAAQEIREKGICLEEYDKLHK